MKNLSRSLIKTASIRAKSDHINGLIKQGASLYKNVLSPLNEKLAYRDLKDPLGPYEADRSAAVAGLDNQVAVDEYIREKHPVQYWLNPLVNGPISEIMHRLSRRHNASMGRSMGMEVGRSAAGLIGGINFPSTPRLGSHAGASIFDIGATIAGGAGSKTRARDTFNTKLKPRLDRTKKRDEEDEAEKTSSDKDSDIGAYTATQLGQFRESDAAVAANEFNRSNRPFHYWLNPYVQGPLGEFKNRYLRRLAAARGTSTPAAVASSIPLLNLIGTPAAALLAGGLKNKNKMRRMSSPDIEDRKKKEVEKDVDDMTYGSNQNYARQRTKESMHVPRHLAFSYSLGKSAAEVGMPQIAPSGSTSSKLPISKVGKPRGLMSIKTPLAGGSQAGNNFFLTDNDPSVSVKKAGILYKKMDPTEPILTRLKKRNDKTGETEIGNFWAGVEQYQKPRFLTRLFTDDENKQYNTATNHSFAVDLDEYKNRPESLKKEVDARSALWLAALVENYPKQYRFEGEDLYTVPEEVALKGPKSNTNLEYKV